MLHIIRIPLQQGQEAGMVAEGVPQSQIGELDLVSFQGVSSTFISSSYSAGLSSIPIPVISANSSISSFSSTILPSTRRNTVY
jgi:hypothetical protein